ncbi:SERCA-type calcium-translocating P-type ATPase [Histomonas meleagridis]|uniref:SERCA-type calcium-translocating P-type ATPase n=1 Tax=Histomonas meleagridis TaxID=135588 RepID=UPI00355A1D71|nr:SERCA-type calcium-translocating P-type ATPase [Histomonas meleagridis]KAH0803205.1 SERCA-type calcium-translocating P-type ATPase [Histomonas meleagridis]
MKNTEESTYEAYDKDPEEIFKHFGTDPVKGLTNEKAQANIEKFGRNAFPPPSKKSILSMIIEQFQDKMVLVLLFAVVLGFIFAFIEEDPEERVTAFIEPWVIIVILALNAFISVMQEINADKSVESLKSFQPNKAHVIRDGEIVEIDAEDIACGDLVEVGEGHQVPADARVIKIKSTVLTADQSALTGESVGANKTVETIHDKELVLSQKTNCCFGGTPLTRGRFQGVVYAVGPKSEIGKIQDAVHKAGETETPLQIKLDKFGAVIAKSILVICIITWLANIPKFKEAGHGNVIKGALSFFKIAVSLAVAAIPEGLPAVVTTTLSLGVNRMAKEKAIVTALPAVETLGCTSVICSDKTGTLTTNQMTVKAFLTVENKDVNVFEVEGDSYAPKGEIKANGATVKNFPQHKAAQMAALIATTCNDATIICEEKDGVEEFKRNGEPTEAAFKILAEKIGLPDDEENSKLMKMSPKERNNKVSDYYLNKYPKVRTHEFTRDRKSMSVIVGKDTLVAKGAFEVILGNCDRYMDDATGEILPLTKDVFEKIDNVRKHWAGGSNCYRCLGLAYKDAPDYKSWDVSNIAQYEKGLIWCGAAGIIDPPRQTVIAAIKECHTAGIRVIMCTGDNPDTAAAIAKKIGMIHENDDITGKVYTGNQWAKMTDDERLEASKHVAVMARVEPIHKQQLVDCLQKQNHIVAMTGDGVNDAPALKKADIGIAMGSGTKVAQDAAKMILSDDSFATIVKAVSEGRAIYNNTTAFIRYLITCNIGEVVSCFVSSIIGGPNLLRSTQLLFVNLVTDGLPATALGVNPAEPGVMDMPPRPKNEEIVTPLTLCRYIVGGIYLGFATIAAAYWWYLYDPTGPHITFKQVLSWSTAPPEMKHIFDDNTPSTMAMSVLVVVEMFSAMTAISERQSIFTFPPTKNKMLVLAIVGSLLVHFLTLELPIARRIFSVVKLDLGHWIVILILGIPTIIIEEIFKFYIRSHTKHVNPDDY